MTDQATPAKVRLTDGLGAWQPITTAPLDGRPVWVRGNNYGDATRGRHFCWAWFDGIDWLSAEVGEGGPSKLLYLTDWLPNASA